MSTGLHPRNRHTGHYDFERLTQASPNLKPFVTLSPRGESTIDFSDPEAVKALNRALLQSFYGISAWDIPTGYLCPPIPGRSDYLHHIADLLAGANRDMVPRGESVRVLDVGTGSSVIYPLIGRCEYGWSFVGTDIDPIAIASAEKIVKANSALSGAVELRRQKERASILRGVISDSEIFDLTICNPPFHASLEEARQGTQRKWDNLGIQTSKLNFGGQHSELWCPGGEASFVRRMIEESVDYAENVFCFSALVSKQTHLPAIEAALQRVGAEDCVIVEMAQGQKKSRVVAWTFLTPEQREAWRTKRWKP